jgi:hypothetical protein
MRYTVILLLLSACASMPESPTGTDYALGPTMIPGYWGYAQGTALSAGASCIYPGYSAFAGPAYFSSYNCATPLLFYSRSRYFPHYSALTPHVPHHGTHPWRHHSSGTSPVATPTVAHAAPGSARKRK